jgi:hypothetical protein
LTFHIKRESFVTIEAVKTGFMKASKFSENRDKKLFDVIIKPDLTGKL